MIEIKNLTKMYDNHLALDDLSFTVNDNEIFGFLGPNGAGKSTTMNIMTGYLSATSGNVLIDGYDIVDDPKNAKKRIGYLPELPPLYMDMTPNEFLRFVGISRGIKKENISAEVDRVVEMTNIKNVRNRLIKTLSKGYRQRVGMASSIIGDPKVIIMDEPTVGLDPIQVIEFRDLIKKLGENHTIILSSHILADIADVCERIMIIVGGKLVAIDTPDNLAQLLGGDNEELSLEEIFFKIVSDAKAQKSEVLGDK